MQLEQPPPDLAIPEPSPFDHLRPTLWQASKAAHITLVSLGTLMLLPGAYVFIGLFFALQFMGGSSFHSEPEVMIALITAVGSTCFGVLAWSALSMLFFKRNDARWQRVCWALCAVFGIIASPCLIGWMLWLGGQGLPSEAGWVFLIFLAMLGTAIACMIFGVRYSTAARDALKHPPTPADQVF